MKDITIIIPLHKFDDKIKDLLDGALESIKKNQETYTFGKLIPLIVAPNNVLEEVGECFGENVFYHTCRNTTDNTDFCSQINFAANKVTTDYFSILEFDDIYTDKWFKMAHDYYYSNESVSLFLPFNILTDVNHQQYQYVNEIAWTSSFSNDIGYLDYDCLQDYSSFNLTGGIFNTEDFKKIGGFKPSIKIAFNYELLLRLTKKELKVFVVPKEGYIHLIGREDSLTDEYNKNIPREDIRKWFDLAKIECAFTEDRKTSISKIKDEELK
jgi:hypothetical protein